MKINLITSHPNAACSMFYAGGLKYLREVSLFDPDIKKFDVLLVMTYDHMIIKSLRENHPSAKIGIVDPRKSAVQDSVRYCDFIIVDSIEMEDFWRRSNKPIFRYVEYPDIPYCKNIHKGKDKIRIGYHGNRIHLECMSERTTPALTRLGDKYNLELLVMYGGGPPPKSNEKWYPKNLDVKFVPWSMKNYIDELLTCDIGIVPNNLIHTDDSTEARDSFNSNKDNYVLKFKMPSNPGRIAVFGRLGIPVVADFYPSAIQCLSENTGLVAHSVGGWEFCLDKLISSPVIRQELGDNLQNMVRNKFDFDIQNKKLISFLKETL